MSGARTCHAARLLSARDFRIDVSRVRLSVMYLIENPVLQRELLVNLRMSRGFVLMLVYQAFLAALVYLAWPQDQRLDLSHPSRKMPASWSTCSFSASTCWLRLMAPSFAAGAITGEKERRTYEMLLASPLRPGAIVLGKLIASLAYLAVLIFASLPIIMLCLPLGGVSPYEVFAAYLGLIVSVITFGAIGIACSSYFKRTAASLVVSYLLILPLAMAGILFWLPGQGLGRIAIAADRHRCCPAWPSSFASSCSPTPASACCIHPTWAARARRSWIWNRKRSTSWDWSSSATSFPTSCLLRPNARRCCDDGANPVYDKEIRSEIFSQGTLMLRVVIQVSMLLAIPLDGLLPVHLAAICAVVHRVRGRVQYAGGPRFLGRQRDQRTRTANAGPAADHRHHALADSLGQTAGRVAGLQRADHVPDVAAAAGVRDGRQLLEQHPGSCWPIS